MRSLRILSLAGLILTGLCIQVSASDILVAYFSRSGNTEYLANMIHNLSGGDLFEIEPVEPYSDDYNETVARFRRERSDDIHPPLRRRVSGMENYRVIFIGYPNWGSDIPPAIRSFIDENNLAGKTIIPFCTHGGGGFGRSVRSIQNACPDSVFAEGFECSGNGVRRMSARVSVWISSLGLGLTDAD